MDTKQKAGKVTDKKQVDSKLNFVVTGVNKHLDPDTIIKNSGVALVRSAKLGQAGWANATYNKLVNVPASALDGDANRDHFVSVKVKGINVNAVLSKDPASLIKAGIPKDKIITKFFGPWQAQKACIPLSQLNDKQLSNLFVG